jgi:hypothetical protein
MGQQEEVYFPWIESEGISVPVVGITTLNEAAVHQHTEAGHFQQVARPGHGASCSEKSKFHIPLFPSETQQGITSRSLTRLSKPEQ